MLSLPRRTVIEQHMGNISVFISYAREDHSLATKVRDFLISSSFDAWMDTYDILPGEKWDDKIHDKLRSADFIVLCLSNHSVTKRGYLQKELRQAVELAKSMLDTDIYIIPARFDDCALPKNISEYQWVDLFIPEGYQRLYAALVEGAKRRGMNIDLTNINRNSTEKSSSADLSELGSSKLLNFLIRKKNKN